MPSFQKLSDKLLFRDKGIVPTTRLLMIWLICSLLLTALSLGHIHIVWLFVIDVCIIAVSCLDLLLSPRKQQLAFEITMPENIERHHDTQMTIHITNNGTSFCNVTLHPGLPQSFQWPQTLQTTSKGGTTEQLTFAVQAPVRGFYTVPHIYVRYQSSLGLWQKQMTHPIRQSIKVIPDLSETRRYLQDPQKYLLHEGTKILKNRRGEGEFTKVRHYAIGDDPRKINWQQTAKLQETMVNEYEPEHGKQVTILLDCGRIMGAELKTEKRLEKVLEAVMAVSAAALSNGDYVSVIAFSKHIKKHVPVGKGMSHLQHIRHELYDLAADTVEANYAEVLSHIQATQSRRCLLLLFSDIYTFLHEDQSLLYLKRLQRKHLFFMMGLKDETLEQLAAQAPHQLTDTMRKSMAQQQIQQTKQQKLTWEKQGITMIEVSGDRLATTAISQYINVMNQGLL